MISKVHDTPPPPSPLRPALLATYALVFACGIPLGFALGRHSMQAVVAAAQASREIAPGKPVASHAAAAAAAPGTTAADPPPGAPPRLRLIGVAANHDSRKTRAWLQDEGADVARPYAAGDWLPGSYQLLSIGADCVVAFRNDEQFTLRRSVDAPAADATPVVECVPVAKQRKARHWRPGVADGGYPSGSAPSSDPDSQ